MRAGRPSVGLSTDSHKRVLSLCHATLTNPRIGADGPAVRAAVLDHCEAQARRALDHAPADAHSWWAMAAFAVERGDFDTTFAALQRSRDYAPYELWIALERDAIDRRLAFLQDVPRRADHDRDLTTLAYSFRGVEGLAQRYAYDPDFRERIVALVERLPADNQRRFLRHVRRAMADLRDAEALFERQLLEGGTDPSGLGDG